MRFSGATCGTHKFRRSYCITLKVTTSFIGYINIFESSLLNIGNFPEFVTYLYNLSFFIIVNIQSMIYWDFFGISYTVSPRH
jgi:hypothetical protein